MPLIIFLMVLCLFCTLFSIKIDSIFKHHTQKAETILESYPELRMLSDFTPHWSNKISISRLFPIFYALCFCFLLTILLKILSGSFIKYIIAPIFLFCISCIFFYKLRYDKPRESKNDLPSSLASSGSSSHKKTTRHTHKEMGILGTSMILCFSYQAQPVIQSDHA